MALHSANLDGTDIRTLLPSGVVHTPKQLVVDDVNSKVYFCDREGMGVHRVNFDGTDHEVLASTGSLDDPEQRKDMTRWCVGITLDLERDYVYWTQKGPSKSGQGQTFRAGTAVPMGQTAENRDDIELLLDGVTGADRSGTGWGESIAILDGSRGTSDWIKKEILARQFHEPIRIKLAGKEQAYVADLGGSVYRVKDGKKTVMWQDNGCYTGIAVLL
ncbi:hypothetical protein BBP40_007305 [Aspergillus hancockii]|nr:hypothetical protein BBP40_007305 [Aspergillus hancockii]